MLQRVNIGCGDVPTPDWINFDNSMSVRLSRFPLVISALGKLGVIGAGERDFAARAQQMGIKWADVTRHIPLPDNSVDALYTSHMMEHLDKDEVRTFLREARRVLSSGGTIRVVVPDIRILVDKYLAEGDADVMIFDSYLWRAMPKTFAEKVKDFVIGDRHHKWMYDGPSMSRLLLEMGFERPVVLPPGKTTIPNPGELDLARYPDMSVYVEACKP